MPRFAQHSTIRARAGKRDELVAKFVEAADMPSLVDGPPEIRRLDPVAIR